MKSLVGGAVDDCPGGRTGVLAGVVVAAMGDCVGGRTGDLAGVDVVVVVVVVGAVVDATVSSLAGAACFGVDVVGFEVDAAAGGVCGGVAGIPKRLPLATRASSSFFSFSSFALLSSSPDSDRPPLL